jgi:hypothetical protein
MDLRTAEALVRRYALVVAAQESLLHRASELPASKSDIKLAIRTVIPRALPSALPSLVGVYGQLAYFVEDSVLAQSPYPLREMKDLAKLDSTIKSVCDEEDSLCEEIESFARANGVTEPLF